MRTRNSIRGFVRPSVGWSVVIELKSGETRISAPSHPSATDGRVSGLVVKVNVKGKGKEKEMEKEEKDQGQEMEKEEKDQGQVGQYVRHVNRRKIALPTDRLTDKASFKSFFSALAQNEWQTEKKGKGNDWDVGEEQTAQRAISKD